MATALRSVLRIRLNHAFRSLVTILLSHGGINQTLLLFRNAEFSLAESRLSQRPARLT